MLWLHDLSRLALHPLSFQLCSPLTVSHLHGLQFGVGSSVEAFHLLLLQPLQQTNSILVDSASLRQHQRSRSVVVAAVRTKEIYYFFYPTHEFCINLNQETSMM